MPTNEDEVIQSEETVESPRDIQTLLALETYQGMTDAEIQSIIDWHERRGYDTALATAQIGIWNDAANTVLDNNNARVSTLENMVQSLVNRNVAMGVIADEQA